MGLGGGGVLVSHNYRNVIIKELIISTVAGCSSACCHFQPRHAAVLGVEL